MVEATSSMTNQNDDQSTISVAGEAGNDDSMVVDEEGTMEVVIKPRNNFTSNALKRAVP